MLHCTFPKEKKERELNWSKDKALQYAHSAKNDRKFNKQGGANTRFGDTELKKENNINDIQCIDEMKKTSGILHTYL